MKSRNLNFAYRLVWSDAQQMFIAVAEFARSRRKRRGAVVLAATLLSTLAQAQQLPTGGQVVAGQGSIASSSTTMTVTQSTANMAVNWQSFSIGQGNTVNFVQPSASAVALNRVLGSDVSVIQGALNANGKVFLVNPNGVLFTPTAQINVGSLVASTLNISTDDFMAGNYRFEGTSSNAITNQGNITAASGGTVALIAARVINAGQIEAPQGNVLMAAGSKVTLDMGGPVKIQVEEGALEALIEQGGVVRADSGLVYLTAKAAGELATSVINHKGITEANSLTGQGGQILLEADQIELANGSSLNATGATGGGEVYVGGGWQGSGDLRQATTVTMEAGATIDVSATGSGDGGTAVLWSNVSDAGSRTQAYGTILANGGSAGGDGGNIETSGHYLDVSGISVSASASSGASGQWLLDPYNITIADSGTSGTPYTNPYTADATSTILASDIEASLNSGTSVSITAGTTGDGGSDAGNIYINADIEKNSGSDASLTFSATGYITFATPSYIGSLMTSVVGSDSYFSISSTSGALDLYIYAGTDGSGGFWLPYGSSITTNGGNVVIGDSTTTGTVTSSYENNALYRGATINGNIDAGGGDISIFGKGAPAAAAARGVSIGGTVQTSGSGTITVTGTGDGSSDAIALGDTTPGLAGALISENGTITINGTSSGTSSSSEALFVSPNNSYIQTTAGDLVINAAGQVRAEEGSYLDIGGATTINSDNSNVTLTSSSNDFSGAITIANAAAVTIVDQNTLTLGTIDASGLINILTLSGNLTLQGLVSSDDTSSSAIILNAGKNTAAGTSSGGDIIVSGGSLATGSGGRATQFTGSLSGSNGVTTLAGGSGSGNYRYNSDESSTNYSTALGTGTYVIYREQPTLTLTVNNDSKSYDGTAYSGGNGYAVNGFINGDLQASITGSPSYGGSAQGATNAGTYALSLSGLSNVLGYALSYTDGTLTITATPPSSTPASPPSTSTPTSEPQQSAVQAAQMLLPTNTPPLSISGGLEFVDVPAGTSGGTTPLAVPLPEGSAQSFAGTVRVFVEDGGILLSERNKRQ